MLRRGAPRGLKARIGSVGRPLLIRSYAASSGTTEEPVDASRSTGFNSRISRVVESFQAPIEKMVLKVPASTANLGPGFDSMGFALDVWNRVVVQRSDKFSMTISGEGADRIELTEDNLVARMTKKALESLGQPMPTLHFDCYNAVPPTRGMGSSSAALVAGLAAGLAFGGKDLTSPATKKLLLHASIARGQRGGPRRQRGARHLRRLPDRDLQRGQLDHAARLDPRRAAVCPLHP